jgi:hypothetical protein
MGADAGKRGPVPFEARRKPQVLRSLLERAKEAPVQKRCSTPSPKVGPAAQAESVHQPVSG